jgi:RHS repeat-associated protein
VISADAVQYDGWERVLSVVSLRNGTVTSRDTFRFDRMGNISTTAGAEVYHPVTNRLTYRVNGLWQDSLVYDAAGNLDSLVSKKAGSTHRWGYDWDALNRLVTVRRNNVTIARYSYDVLGRRIAKRVYVAGTGGTVAYTRFAYHGDHVAFEADSGGGSGIRILKRYVWGMGTDDLIAVRDSSLALPVHYYAVKDKLGSVRGLVTRGGTWQHSERFGPYGAQIEISGSDQGLRYKWTGREFDGETGFYYFRARYYEPAGRRFVSEDPIGYVGGGNLYAYVSGDVMEARDPTGLLKDVAYFGSGGPDNWWDPEAWLNFASGGAWGLRQEMGISSSNWAAQQDAVFGEIISPSVVVTYANGAKVVFAASAAAFESGCTNDPTCSDMLETLASMSQAAGRTTIVHFNSSGAGTNNRSITEYHIFVGGLDINPGNARSFPTTFNIALAHEMGHVYYNAVVDMTDRARLPGGGMHWSVVASESVAMSWENRMRRVSGPTYGYVPVHP